MKFRFEQFVPERHEIVFAFFQNPRCLSFLHAEEKQIRVLRHGSSVAIGKQTWAEITFLGVLPVVLGFRHDLFEAPHRFGESLIHGLFKSFTHVHEFREKGEGAIVTDWIEVALPWFYGGELGVRLFVKRGLEQSFAVRRRALERMAASGELRRAARENLELMEAV